MEYENKTLEEKINDQEIELSRKVADLSMYQVKLDELNEELENRGEMYNRALQDNDILQNENNELIENIKLHQNEEIRLRNEVELTKNKLNENIEILQDNEEEIKKLNDLIEVKHDEIEELRKIKENLNNEIEQKQEEIKIQKSQRREEVKKRNQAERNLRITEIDNMTIRMLKEILNSNFGYDFDRKPYIKVAELRNMLIREEGLTEKLKTPLSTPQKKRHEEKDIDYV